MQSALGDLADDALAGLVQGAAAASDSLGGRTQSFVVEGIRVFCKLVPLTALECRPEHHLSTANLFRLPAYYQYGIGSTGFGAWRELAAHQLASGWVVAGRHDQFPLLHHWRVLRWPATPTPDPHGDAYLTHAAAQGRDESAIRERLTGLRAARHCIAIVAEHVPHTVSGWLVDQLNSQRATAGSCIDGVERQARAALDFMRRAGFVHFDAHLDNVLTDGTRLYFSDFGLALHDSFDLTPDARRFLASHDHYDAVRFAASLVHTICRAVPGDAAWMQTLARSEQVPLPLPPAANAALRTHAPAARYMAQFGHTLIHVDRLARFAPPPNATPLGHA